MRITRRLITIVVLSISFLLSLFVLWTPIPEITDTDFSAIKAAGYIKEISLEPHSVFDPVAHEEVRLYLKGMLEEFVGTENVTEYNYTGLEVGSDYDIKNLLATIPGNSDTAILLVAHYDSRGHIGRMGELGGSYGAADDGYGLATLLEIARLYGGRTDLENTIYILMTDGEETGLYGAEMAAGETDLMDNVGFVINIEARGIEGPAYMFETSKNNSKVIDFYKNADFPISYSIATAVYTVMPNSTDFTEFLAIDKQGINFAVLDSLYYYHTPRDNYTSINQSSIQHYGAQITPLVDEFVTSSVYSDVHYFEGTEDQVFFNLFSNIFIAYTDTFATILHFLTLVLFILLFVFLVIKKDVKPLKVLKQLGIIFGVIILLAIFGIYVSKLFAFLGHTSWSLTYVRMDGSELPAYIIIGLVVIGLVWAYKKLVVNRMKEENEFMLAGIFLLILFALATGFILSGASFLFFIPALFGVISLTTRHFVKNRVVEIAIYSLTFLINILILVPLVYSLFLALTVGGLMAFLIVIWFYLLILAPTFYFSIE